MPEIIQDVHSKSTLEYKSLYKLAVKTQEQYDAIIKDAKDQCANIHTYTSKLNSLEKMEIHHFKELVTVVHSLASYICKVMAAYHMKTNDIGYFLQQELGNIVLENMSLVFTNKHVYNLILKLKENTQDAVDLNAIEDYIESYEMQGVHFDSNKQKELNEIIKIKNQYSDFFSYNVTQSSGKTKVLVHLDDLDGMPESMIKSILSKNNEAAEYTLANCEVTLDVGMMRNAMTYVHSNTLRKKLHKSLLDIASHDSYDNYEHPIKIVEQYHKLAQIYGFSSYSEFAMHRCLKRNTDYIERFLEKVLEGCTLPALDNIASISKYVDTKLHQSDIAYGINRWKKEHLGEDKLVFPTSGIFKGIFSLCLEYFGITFDVTYEDANITSYALKDAQSGHLIGNIIMDIYYREDKHNAGAYMEGIDYASSTATLTCNFSKGADLDIRDVETLLHELGHCLHHVFSKVPYYNIAGTSVKQFLVEIPSQIFENFLDFVLEKGCGIKFKEEEKKALRKFNAISYYRQSVLSLVDLNIYKNSGDSKHPYANAEFIMKKYSLGSYDSYNMNWLNSFMHAFSYDNYAACYSQYLWSRVIADNMFDTLKATYGENYRSMGTHLVSHVLSKGNTWDYDINAETDINAWLKRTL